MSFQKMISLMLVAAQLGLPALSFSSDEIATPHSTQTAEFQLLQTVVALQGQGIAESAIQTAVAKAMGDYVKSAPVEGQQERMRDALVELGVYTPAQASAFVSEAQHSAERLSETADSSAMASALVDSEARRLAQLHPTGAQFSVCDSGFVLGFSGAVAASLGIGLHYNQTCGMDGPVYSCSGGRHQGLAKQLMIYGAVAIAVGTAVYLLTGDCASG